MGRPNGYVVRLRPEAYQRLQDLVAEISRKRGVQVSKAKVLEAGLELIDRLESMEHENDLDGFDAANSDRRILY